MSNEPEQLAPLEEAHESKTLRVIGWFSIGMAVAAVGIYVGAEMRNRYKFKRRTQYDFYSNAGEQPASEFGMGI
jgi:lactate dehydrogenase-like 2-hydroxyacid dehydrogenase